MSLNARNYILKSWYLWTIVNSNDCQLDFPDSEALFSNLSFPRSPIIARPCHGLPKSSSQELGSCPAALREMANKLCPRGGKKQNIQTISCFMFHHSSILIKSLSSISKKKKNMFSSSIMLQIHASDTKKNKLPSLISGAVDPGLTF